MSLAFVKAIKPFIDKRTIYATPRGSSPASDDQDRAIFREFEF
jgi:hypothetical protein